MPRQHRLPAPERLLKPHSAGARHMRVALVASVLIMLAWVAGAIFFWHTGPVAALAKADTEPLEHYQASAGQARTAASISAAAAQAHAVREAGAPQASARSPALHALALKHPVWWHAPLYSGTGFSSEALSYILALLGTGWVRPEDMWVSQHGDKVDPQAVEKLLPEDRALLRRLERRASGAERRAPAIVICHSTSMFEAEGLPEGYANRLNAMDEVWVPSAWNKRSFSAAGVNASNIVVVPEAVNVTRFDPDKHEPMDLLSRSQLLLGSPERQAPPPGRRPFTFLSTFKFELRKGWDVLLAAYLLEFAHASDDVQLVILSKPESVGQGGQPLLQLVRGLVEPLVHAYAEEPHEGLLWALRKAEEAASRPAEVSPMRGPGQEADMRMDVLMAEVARLGAALTQQQREQQRLRSEAASLRAELARLSATHAGRGGAVSAASAPGNASAGAQPAVAEPSSSGWAPSRVARSLHWPLAGHRLAAQHSGRLEDSVRLEDRAGLGAQPPQEHKGKQPPARGVPQRPREVRAGGRQERELLLPGPHGPRRRRRALLLHRRRQRTAGVVDKETAARHRHGGGRGAAPAAPDPFPPRAAGSFARRVPPVRLITNALSDAELPGFYKAGDAFVLPSRGEGWGRPHVEAMSMGLPLIATNWSGITAYLDESVGYPLAVQGIVDVDERLQRAGLFAGHRWAQPSVHHLRQLMREVYEDREAAASRGAAGRRRMVEHFSPEAVAAQLAAELSRVDALLTARS